MRADMDDVQVQIVNWKRADLTIACVEALRAMEGPRPVTVVVDNGSGDGSAERIAAACPEVELLRSPTNEGFTGGHNRAFRHGLAKERRFFLLLNNDARPERGCLRALLEAAGRDPQRGILGAWVLQDLPVPRLETRGVHLSPATGRMVHLGFGEEPPAGAGVEEVAAVSGCAMLVRREVLDRAGTFDPDYFAYFEDLDLCARARRAGFRVVSVPAARVIHRGKVSSGGPEAASWVFYAVRNHLLFLDRNFPLVPPWRSALRRAWVIALNLAHVVLVSPMGALEGIRAVRDGARAYGRRALGARP